MTDFSVHEDKLFMDLLKRRAYMLAFPDQPVAAAEHISIQVRDSDGCCGHAELWLSVGDTGNRNYKDMSAYDLPEFLRTFFGVEA